MLDFLKGLFIWLGKYILFLFFPVIGWIVFLCENFPEFMTNVWAYCWNGIKWYFQDFYLWLFAQLGELLTTFFADNDFIVGVVEFSNATFTAMNVFIPLNELCVCVTLIVSTMISVFLLRIILKAVPTIW